MTADNWPPLKCNLLRVGLHCIQCKLPTTLHTLSDKFICTCANTEQILEFFSTGKTARRKLPFV